MILGYCRVSTSDQAKDDRYSLRAQERVIRGFAMAQGASSFDVQMYVDEGISGTVPLRIRAQGAAMIEAAQPGDTIVGAKLDRMFRDCKDALQTAEELHKRGVKLVAYDIGVEPVCEGATAKFFFTVMAAAASMERERILERMRMSKEEKRSNGGHAGGVAPYGFKIVGKGRTAKLEMDPDEQVVIDYVRGQWNERVHMCGIVKNVNARGFRTRAGKEFCFLQVQRILERLKNETREAA